jgi:hypothetical protein
MHDTCHGEAYIQLTDSCQSALVLSGKLPYHHLKKDTEVLIELHQSVHPLCLSQLVDKHWELICCCWAEYPNTRPNVREIFECVQHHYQALSAAADCESMH